MKRNTVSIDVANVEDCMEAKSLQGFGENDLLNIMSQTFACRFSANTHPFEGTRICMDSKYRLDISQFSRPVRAILSMPATNFDNVPRREFGKVIWLGKRKIPMRKSIYAWINLVWKKLSIESDSLNHCQFVLCYSSPFPFNIYTLEEFPPTYLLCRARNRGNESFLACGSKLGHSPASNVAVNFVRELYELSDELLDVYIEADSFLVRLMTH